MSSRSRWLSPTLIAAVAVYAVLAGFSARDVGIVGEVAIGWALEHPPEVLVQIDPPVSSDTDAGWLRAARTRPTERLVVAGAELPLAINAYTGGLADWPARLTRALTGEYAAGAATNLALGALLLTLAHRFLTFHGSRIAASAAAFVLATDWCFVFYRRVLGGTEILLQAATLLTLWALWSRRWKGGVHGTVAIAVGVALGLHAKATFLATLAAFGGAVLLTRWDHPHLKPPRRVHPGVLVGVPLLGVAPLLLAAWDASQLSTPLIPSHDTLGLQLSRFAHGWSAGTPAREGAANLLYFFGEPLAFFGPAYGATPVAPVSVLRALGLGLTVGGALMEWRDRAPSAAGALLRFLSLFVPLQVALLWVANHDLHHLAQASVPLALLVALAAERLAASLAPPRSAVRGALTALFVLPMLVVGARSLSRTDAVLATVRSPSFTESGQADLVRLLREHHVERLVASDYELYGMLEVRAPEIAVTHTWGAVARGAKGPEVLRLAEGGWYLAVRASAPMVYNWSPDARKVAKAAEEAGVRATAVGSVEREGATWATLYRVEPL